MDELKRLHNSRKGYRLHLNKLLTKAKETLDHYQTSEMEFNTAALTDIHRQLQRKDDIISKLDSQIVPLIGDEEELVADVCEAEEMNPYQPPSLRPWRFWKLTHPVLSHSSPSLNHQSIQTPRVIIHKMSHHRLISITLNKRRNLALPNPLLPPNPDQLVKVSHIYPNSVFPPSLETSYNSSLSGIVTALRWQ